MGQVILETGREAEVPYYVEKFYVNLHSVEELCYLFVERAELLDEDIMRRELVQWLDEQCGLSELAHTLSSLMNQNGSTMAFVGAILEYVRLYPPEIINYAEQTVKNNEGLSPLERAKAKADYMLQNRKYFTALGQYHGLLEKIPEADVIFRAKILHNMGVACANLFLFDAAAQRFLEAYEADGSEESLQMHLASLRIKGSEQDYLAYIAAHPEYHSASLQVERQMNRAYGQFEGTDENRMLFTLQVFKEEGSGAGGASVKYYQEIEKLAVELKAAYRDMYH